MRSLAGGIGLIVTSLLIVPLSLGRDGKEFRKFFALCQYALRAIVEPVARFSFRPLGEILKTYFRCTLGSTVIVEGILDAGDFPQIPMS